MTEDPAAKRARVSANVVKMQAQGASDDEIEHYVRDIEGLAPVGPSASPPPVHGAPPLDMPRVASDMTAGRGGPRRGTPVRAAVGAPDPAAPGIGSKVLGAIAAVDRDVPGAEAAQAGVRALVRGQSYPDARADIRTAEDAAPAAARVPARLLGGTLAAMALPGGAVTQGATYGGLNGLLQSNPDAGVGARARDTAIGGVTGAVVGKAADVVGVLARSKLPVALGGVRSLGDNALNRKATMAAADATAFGQAATEGDLAGTNPAIQQALAAKDIQPYVKAVRSTRAFANANDNTVLREAYKLMSERQTMLAGRLSNNDFKAGTSLENRDVGAAKQQLLNATEATDAPAAVELPLPDRGGRTLSIRDANGRVRRDLRGVSDDALGTEWQRLAEMNGQEEGEHAAVQDAGYRTDYEDLPNTEKHGRRGQEDLPDADGAVDPERLAQDNATVSEYRRGTLVRGARERVMARIQEELAGRPSMGDFDFGARASAAPPQGPFPSAMPSFRAAVQQHAEMAGDRDAFRLGADAGKRVIKGAQPAAKNLEQKSPEAVLNVIQQMSPGRAQAASEGVIGALKNNSGLKANPFTGFGVFPALRNANRVSPYVSVADDVSGNNTGSILRAAGIDRLTPSP